MSSAPKHADVCAVPVMLTGPVPTPPQRMGSVVVASPCLEPEFPANTISLVFSKQAKLLLVKKDIVKAGRKEKLLAVTCGGQEGIRLWDELC